MKRPLGSLITIFTFASAACDDGVPAAEVAQNRASEGDSSVVVVVPDSGSTDGGSAEVRVRVTNVGEPCELLGRDCQGSGSQCLEISFSGAIYTGGYCTSDCERSAECGTNAVCPVAEAMVTAPDYPFRATWARKCFRSCTPGVAGQCRTGYACTSLADAYAVPDAPAPMHRTTCLPRGPGSSTASWDSGVGLSNGIDAGR